MQRRHYRLLIKAFLVVAIVRVILSVRGYRAVLDLIAKVQPSARTALSLSLLSWAVVRTAAFIPGASCMTQALALKYLAAREGEVCIVRIGVKHDPGKPFEAHAWVLYKGAVVIGGQQERIDEFSPITDL